METRELFERLITDEPPLSVSAPAMSARGHAAARRRWAGRGTGALAAVAVVTAAAVQLGEHPLVRQSGDGPGPGPAKTFASLPFRSAEQITAANARVYALLVARAGGPQSLIKGSPLSAGAPVHDDSSMVQSQVQYPLGADSAIVSIMTTKPNNLTAKGGIYTTSPCTVQTIVVQLVDCARSALPGGGYVWTFSQRRTTDQATYGRSAVLVAADGSMMAVNAYVNKGLAARDQVDATPSQVLQASDLSQLAQRAALAWEGFATAPVPLTTAEVPVPAPSRPVADLGPALGATLAFTSADQIKAANQAEFTWLESLGGGADNLTTAKPLWDTDPISDQTTFVGDQVSYPSQGQTAVLTVVNSNAADARTRYDGLLAHPLCPQLKSNAEKAFTGCVAKSVAGATLYTYATVEAYAGENTDRQQGSPDGPATYERDAIVVLADGSVVDVTFQLQDAQGTPVALTDTVGISDSNLGLVALDVARAWQSPGSATPAAASASQ